MNHETSMTGRLTKKKRLVKYVADSPDPKIVEGEEGGGERVEECETATSNKTRKIDNVLRETRKEERDEDLKKENNAVSSDYDIDDGASSQKHSSDIEKRLSDSQKSDVEEKQSATPAPSDTEDETDLFEDSAENEKNILEGTGTSARNSPSKDLFTGRTGDEDDGLESDLNTNDAHLNFKSLETLSYSQFQRFIVDKIQNLESSSKQLKKSVEDTIEKERKSPLSYITHPGTSKFPRNGSREQKRYLSFSKIGWIAQIVTTVIESNSVASLYPQQTTSEENATTDEKKITAPHDCASACPAKTSSTDHIEIECLVTGVGRRRQKVLNSNNFNLASLGEDGYALAVSHDNNTNSTSDLTSESRHSSYNGNDGSGSSSSSDVNIYRRGGGRRREVSLIEYHPYAGWGQISKSWWYQILPEDEDVTCLAIGRGFISVQTSQRNLRIYTSTGVLFIIVTLYGSPVCLVARDSLLLSICLISTTDVENNNNNNNNNNIHKRKEALSLYHIRLLHINKTLEIANVKLSLPSDRRIVWAGLSDHMIPVIVDSEGYVQGLFPLFRSSPVDCHRPSSSSSSTIYDWVPLLSLGDTIGSQYGGGRPPKYWVAYASAEALFVHRVTDSSHQPLVSPNLPLISLPYRLAVGSSNGEAALKYVDWIRLIDKDPEFKDVGGSVGASGDVLNEVYIRTSQQKSHIEHILKLQEELETRPDILKSAFGETCGSRSLGGTYNEVKSSSTKLSVKADKLLFRMFLKAINDTRLELAYEISTLFTAPKVFKLALKQSERKGLRSLCERLQLEIEGRVIEEEKQHTVNTSYNNNNNNNTFRSSSISVHNSHDNNINSSSTSYGNISSMLIDNNISSYGEDHELGGVMRRGLNPRLFQSQPISSLSMSQQPSLFVSEEISMKRKEGERENNEGADGNEKAAKKRGAGNDKEILLDHNTTKRLRQD